MKLLHVVIDVWGGKKNLSLDTPSSENEEINRPDDVHTPKFLNIISASGLPNDIDQSLGLCNGTRLIIVTRMGNMF